MKPPFGLRPTVGITWEKEAWGDNFVISNMFGEIGNVFVDQLGALHFPSAALMIVSSLLSTISASTE
jgi:hypothetical protein